MRAAGRQMAQIGHGVGQARDRAVGPDAVEPHRHMRHWLVHAESQREDRRAHQVHISLQRSAVKSQRAGIILPLVAGEFGAEPNDAVLPAVRARVLGRADAAPGGFFRAVAQAAAVEKKRLAGHVRAAPGCVGDPTSWNLADAAAGRLQIHDVGAVRRVGLNAGGNVFEPAVPPAQRFLQKADPRLGHGEVRVFVRPGADDAFNRGLHRVHQLRYRVGVRIVPATHGQHSGLDRADVFAHRAVLPIRVAVRVLQPGNGQQRLVFEPVQPHGAPALAHNGRVRRPRRVGQHGGRPAQVFAQHAAAFVVDVVAVAVHRGAQGDDGLQARRTPRGDLQAVEAAPGNTHHADAPGAPGLGHRPGDHLFRIGQLLLGVFVVHQAIRITVAAHVHAQAGVTVAGQKRVGERVADDGAVALAVGQVFQDDRHRFFQRIGRHPGPCGQADAVAQRDEQVGGFGDGAGKAAYGFHRATLAAAARAVKSGKPSPTAQPSQYAALPTPCTPQSRRPPPRNT